MLIVLVLFLSYLLYLFNFILCKNSLANDLEQALPAKIGTTIKPIPVTDNVIDNRAKPIKTTVSTDSNIEVSVF